MKIHIPAVSGAVLVVLLLTAAACSASARPSVSEWEPGWTTAVAAMPSLERLGDPPGRDTCSHTLGLLRSSASELLPTPDPVLDATVKKWLSVAEEAMFECPPTSAEVPSLNVAYDELARLKAEIDVVLEIDLARD